MVIDGAAADGEDLRDLAVRLPVGDQIEHLALTRGQRGDTGAAPPRFPRGLLRHRHDRVSLGYQVCERQASTGGMEGGEPLLSQGRTSGGVGLLVDRPVQWVHVAARCQEASIDGAEQSCRRFRVAVFDGYGRESSQGFEEPNDVGGVDQRAETLVVVPSCFWKSPLAGRKHPQ